MRGDERFYERTHDGSVLSTFVLSPEAIGKSGATGTVYPHPFQSDKAIKIYHESQRATFEPKIRIMSKVRYNRRWKEFYDFAWPDSLIYDDSFGFVGFSMPLFDNEWVIMDDLMQGKSAWEDYSIGDMERFVITRNLALALKYLHSISFFCIDLKPNNIMVNQNKFSIAIIDCDGMSVRDIAGGEDIRFSAQNQTPDFLAPENWGNGSMREIANEKQQDLFALAKIVFTMLNYGIQPYQGTLLEDIREAESVSGKIKNDLYPYGPGKGRIRPHKNCQYSYWPFDLCSLFDQAFSKRRVRPNAEEWVRLLDTLIKRAGRCHVFPKAHVSFEGLCSACARLSGRRTVQGGGKQVGVSAGGKENTRRTGSSQLSGRRAVQGGAKQVGPPTGGKLSTRRTGSNANVVGHAKRVNKRNLAALKALLFMGVIVGVAGGLPVVWNGFSSSNLSLVQTSEPDGGINATEKEAPVGIPLGTPDQPEKAPSDQFTFRVCNNSPQSAVVSIMGREVRSDNLTVRGWFRVEAGECENFGSFDKSAFYAYARNRSGKWGNGDIPVCVYREKFSYENVGTVVCENQVRFKKFDIQASNFTWRLN